MNGAELADQRLSRGTEGQTAVDGLHAPDGTLRNYSIGKTLARIAD